MSAARMLSTAVIAFGFMAADSILAQDTKKERASVTKVLLENDKVRITESTFLPGDVSRADRKPRANYILQGGTLERTTKAGKKTVYKRETGTAHWLEADSDVVKNVGKTTFVVISVQHK